MDIKLGVSSTNSDGGGLGGLSPFRTPPFLVFRPLSVVFAVPAAVFSIALQVVCSVFSAGLRSVWSALCPAGLSILHVRPPAHTHAREGLLLLVFTSRLSVIVRYIQRPASVWSAGGVCYLVDVITNPFSFPAGANKKQRIIKKTLALKLLLYQHLTIWHKYYL